MNVKVKSILIILAVFILGLFTGAMLNRALIQHRIQKALALRNPAPFITTIERIIDPTPEQYRHIRKILEKHAKNIYTYRREFHKSTLKELNSLKKELETVLTEEQKRRLEHSYLNRLRRPRRMPPFRTPPRRTPWPPKKDHRTRR